VWPGSTRISSVPSLPGTISGTTLSTAAIHGNPYCRVPKRHPSCPWRAHFSPPDALTYPATSGSICSSVPARRSRSISSA
jgi:hypothetical protein